MITLQQALQNTTKRSIPGIPLPHELRVKSLDADDVPSLEIPEAISAEIISL